MTRRNPNRRAKTNRVRIKETRESDDARIVQESIIAPFIRI